jgi:hypothetical protein
MIRPLVFLDAHLFTAHYVAKFRKTHQREGVLHLRDLGEDGVDVEDMSVLKEWNSARTLLSKIRHGAAPFFKGLVPEIGRAWIESLPPETCSPWAREEGDYADAHLRLRMCLIPGTDSLSCSGLAREMLHVNILNQIDHKRLCCEMNLGQTARVHLVVDVRVPDEAPEA